jgi:hypothetical protein
MNQLSKNLLLFFYSHPKNTVMSEDIPETLRPEFPKSRSTKFIQEYQQALKNYFAARDSLLDHCYIIDHQDEFHRSYKLTMKGLWYIHKIINGTV